jgi:hypothetical protein
MLRALSVGILSIFISACGTAIQKEELTGCEHPSGWCKEIRETAVKTYLYAQMSSNTYEDSKPFILPAQYRLVKTVPNDSIGFAYNIYEELQNGKVIKVIVAFRGTEDFTDWWYGNFQRKQNQAGLDLIDSLRKTSTEDVALVVTGHSLGGGISTEISLKRKNVKSFVFNPSPNFEAGDKPEVNERLSIVEYGEGLKLARMPGREATQMYTSIGCSKGGPIGQHAQLKLSTCLTQIAAIESAEAKKSLEVNNLPDRFSIKN